MKKGTPLELLVESSLGEPELDSGDFQNGQVYWRLWRQEYLLTLEGFMTVQGEQILTLRVKDGLVDDITLSKPSALSFAHIKTSQ